MHHATTTTTTPTTLLYLLLLPLPHLPSIHGKRTLPPHLPPLPKCTNNNYKDILGGDCVNNETTYKNVVRIPGYWKVPWRNHTFYPCPYDTDCNGTLGQTIVLDHTMDHTITNSSPTTISMDRGSPTIVLYRNMDPNMDHNTDHNTTNNSLPTECSAGSEGTLCATCAPAHLRQGSKCVKCNFDQTTVKLSMSIVAMVCIVATYMSIKKYRKTMTQQQIVIHRRATKDILSVISLLVSFGQISNSLPMTLHHVQFPKEFLRMMDYLAILNGNLYQILGLGCLTGINYELSFVMLSMVPLLICLVGLVWYCINKKMSIRSRANLTPKKRRELEAEALSTLFKISDKDHSGIIEPDELCGILKEMGWLATNKKALFVMIELNGGFEKGRTDHGGIGMDEPEFVKTFLDGSMERNLKKHRIFQPGVFDSSGGGGGGGGEQKRKHRNSVLVQSTASLKTKMAQARFRCCTFARFGQEQISITNTDSLVQWTLDHNLFTNSLSGVTQLLLLAHTPVSRAALQYFSCDEIEGKWFLRADYSFECFTARWYSFLPYVMFILIVVTVAVPVTIMVYLLKHRHELYSITVFTTFGHLYSTFRRGAEFWEMYMLFSMMFLTGLLVFVPEVARGIAATIICFFMSSSLNYYQPHKRRILFWLTQISFALTAQKYVMAMTLVTVKDDPVRLRQIEFVLITLDLIFMLCVFISIVLIIALLRSVMHKGYGMEKSLTKIMNNASLDDIDDNGNGTGKSSKSSKSRSKKKKGSVLKSEASQILHDFVHTNNDFKQRKNKEKRKHSNATMQRVIARRRVKQTKALHKVPAFEKLPNASLDKMADRMKYLKFAPGQQLCIEGEPADRFFIIVSGQCGVYVASKEENVSPLRVATLHALDFLGENALLRDENKRVRNATVTCEVGVTQVLSLERRPYELLVKGGYISEESAKLLALTGQKREELNQKSLLDAGSKQLVPPKQLNEEIKKDKEEKEGGRAVVVEVGPDAEGNVGGKQRSTSEQARRSLGRAPSPPPHGVSILHVEK